MAFNFVYFKTFGFDYFFIVSEHLFQFAIDSFSLMDFMLIMLTRAIDTVGAQQPIIAKAVEYDDAIMFETSHLILHLPLVHINLVIHSILLFEVAQKLIDLPDILVDISQLFLAILIIKYCFLVSTLIIYGCVIWLFSVIFGCGEGAGKPIFLSHYCKQYILNRNEQ